MKKNLHWNHKSEIPKPEIPMNLSKEKYVNIAEKVVLHLKGANASERFIRTKENLVLRTDIEAGKQKFDLTTTKIRNLLSLLNMIIIIVLCCLINIHKIKNISPVLMFKK